MCIFCKIVNNDIPSYKIYEDDDYLAFLDISQATVGHAIVIPKKHYANIFELDENTVKGLFLIVKKISELISKNLNIKNFNILNNNGLLAGQTVDHFHVHIIPRYESDDLTIKFDSHKLSNLEFISLQKKILN